MGTISVSLPSDGSTADVSDYNTPITTIVTALNGNIDANNLADNAVTTAKAGFLQKSVDANGWTVYDYGKWQVYKKKGTTTFGIGGSAWNATTIVSGNLPVGFTTIGANFVDASVRSGDPAVVATLSPTSTDTNIKVNLNNTYSGTVSDTIYWSVSITTA